MVQKMNGLCAYDDKRYLLADLLDNRPNPNTHAYCHCSLAAKEHLMAEQPETGAELIIRHPEERFVRRHARVVKRLELAGAIKMEKELPDGEADGEHHGDQLLITERVAAVRPGCAIRMDEVRGNIARDIFERPFSPSARMLAQPTPHRAGPSGLNAHLTTFRGRMNSSDEDELERPV